MEKIWVGATRPGNNSGDLSAFYHYNQWLLSSTTPSKTERRKVIFLLGVNSASVHLLCLVKGHCNMELIRRIRPGLSLVKVLKPLYIGSLQCDYFGGPGHGCYGPPGRERLMFPLVPPPASD